MKVLVIFNPLAGSGSADDKTIAVKSALDKADLTYDLFVTQSIGQGRHEAERAGNYDAVVAAGGDGTVNEVVSGLLSLSGEGPSRPFGILPLGTGNDFCDMAAIPRDLDMGAQVIADGFTRQVDAGWVSFATGNGQTNQPSIWRGHYFNNNCALAMETVVTLETSRHSRISGNIRYVVGVLRSLLKMRSWQMRIRWDGGELEESTYLFSVANTPRTGGLFTVAPGAVLDDGLLDFVFAPKLPLPQVLALLPKLLDGSHVNHPAVVTGRTRRLTVQSLPATPIHVDGEVIARHATAVSYQVLPGKLTLLSPEK